MALAKAQDWLLRFSRIAKTIKGVHAKYFQQLYLSTAIPHILYAANIFLTPQEQAVFCKMHKSIYPVPNKWGEKGATTFDLNTVPRPIVTEALLSAYNKILS